MRPAPTAGVAMRTHPPTRARRRLRRGSSPSLKIEGQLQCNRRIIAATPGTTSTDCHCEHVRFAENPAVCGAGRTSAARSFRMAALLPLYFKRGGWGVSFLLARWVLLTACPSASSGRSLLAPGLGETETKLAASGVREVIIT